MTNNWQKIDEIFPAVADLPRAERERRLRELCGGDENLRREIAAMLTADEKAEDFIERPVLLPESLSQFFSAAHETGESRPSGFAGRTIGAYRLVRPLGAGGMGTVYLAERADGEFRKKVAVKLLKSGRQTTLNRRRFRHERQILAALEHPNIARLLDGGTTADGEPYFVMEYVEGKTLFDFCRSRDLNLIERLQLFRQICGALAYAHESGIIHRDIKPGNILVTNDGSVKLLDFGIAKIFDSELIHDSIVNTETLQRQMTPEYASPEQVCGEEITPASDVYSLGVCLYELLSGERPYKFTSRAPHEIARIVCEQEVRNPKINFETPLSDDLKFIVLKSLQKKPSERYGSIRELDRDIERFLEGLPILSQSERIVLSDKSVLEADAAALEKFESIEVRAETDRFDRRSTASLEPGAERKNRRAYAAAFGGVALLAGVTALAFNAAFLQKADLPRKIVFMKNSPLPEKPTTAATPANGRVENERPRTTDAVANDLYLAGKQQMESRTPESIDKAIEFFAAAVKRDANFTLAYSGLADAHILRAGGRPSPSPEDYQKAEDYAVKALALDPDLAEARVSLAMAKFRNSRDFAASEKHFLRAIELDPSLSTAHHWYSVVLVETGKFEDALREIKTAAELNPGSAVIRVSVGEVCLLLKRYDEAESHFDKTIAIDADFSIAYYLKSLLQQYRGEYGAALETYRKARILRGADEKDAGWLVMQAQTDAANRQPDAALSNIKRFLPGGKYGGTAKYFANEIALVYNLLGDSEKAFAWLEKAVIRNPSDAENLINDPRFANLHGTARFEGLAKKWRAALPPNP